MQGEVEQIWPLHSTPEYLQTLACPRGQDARAAKMKSGGYCRITIWETKEEVIPEGTVP